MCDIGHYTGRCVCRVWDQVRVGPKRQDHEAVHSSVPPRRPARTVRVGEHLPETTRPRRASRVAPHVRAGATAAARPVMPARQAWFEEPAVAASADRGYLTQLCERVLTAPAHSTAKANRQAMIYRG
jgi:hypothetical protein